VERTLIAWNFPNWVTVLLMAAAGYVVLAFVSQMVKGQTAAGGGGF
jgi:hypothetical protein